MYNLIRSLVLLSFIACLSTAHASIWSGANKQIPETGIGKKVAVSCHNCYVNASNQIAATLNVVAAAIAADADLIEIDLHSTDGQWFVTHETDKTQKFSDVLKFAPLKNADQILFLEIKTGLLQTSDTYMTDNLVQLLIDNGYISPGRPIFIRSFSESTLDTFRGTLQKPQFAALAGNFKLSKLFGKSDRTLASWKSIISATATKNHMIEFHYETKNLFGAIEYAKSLGLSISLFTISEFVEVFAGAYREHVDALTIEGNASQGKMANIIRTRQVINASNNLLDINVGPQTTSGNLKYYDLGSVAYLNRNQAGFPLVNRFTSGTGGLYGTVLTFSGSNGKYLRFHDRDNNLTGGFLVSTAVNFQDLSVGPTQAIVNKSDVGAFALELHYGQLRFGVHVNGDYRYVNYPMTNLSTAESYHVIAAYDGDGGVRMWINGVHVSGAPVVTGGVTLNNAEITLGADPQGASDQQFFFTGKVQHVHVMRWEGF